MCHLCIVKSKEMLLLAAGKGLRETKCLALIVISVLKQLKPFSVVLTLGLNTTEKVGQWLVTSVFTFPFNTMPRALFSLSFSSAGKGQFLTSINFFKTTYIDLVNHQEIAGGKNCCLRR